MTATREDLVRIARDVVASTHDKHDYFGNPVAFDPHEWVLEAMQRAWRAGYTACATYPLTTDSENTGRG